MEGLVQGVPVAGEPVVTRRGGSLENRAVARETCRGRGRYWTASFSEPEFTTGERAAAPKGSPCDRARVGRLHSPTRNPRTCGRFDQTMVRRRGNELPRRPVRRLYWSQRTTVRRQPGADAVRDRSTRQPGAPGTRMTEGGPGNGTTGQNHVEDGDGFGPGVGKGNDFALCGIGK